MHVGGHILIKSDHEALTLYLVWDSESETTREGTLLDSDYSVRDVDSESEEVERPRGKRKARSSSQELARKFMISEFNLVREDSASKASKKSGKGKKGGKKKKKKSKNKEETEDQKAKRLEREKRREEEKEAKKKRKEEANKCRKEYAQKVAGAKKAHQCVLIIPNPFRPGCKRADEQDRRCADTAGSRQSSVPRIGCG